MRSRPPSWILFLYVGIDLANPFALGAFRFTPEEARRDGHDERHVASEVASSR